MKSRLLLCVLLGAASVLMAQDRDFLTPDEVDQIRQTQEPNARLTLYVRFAKQRIELLRQYIAKDKPGRSIFIHDTLEDYRRIIESIDTVSDDALKRHAAIDTGTIAVLNAEKEYLDALSQVQSSEPRDFDRYKFVLQQAIDATSDSRELAMEDSKKRGDELATADSKEKKERDAMLPQKERADRKKSDEAEAQTKKKIPSLYKPGEKKPSDDKQQ